MDDIIKILRRALEPLKRSIQLSVGRCIVAAVTDKANQEIQASLYAGETRDLERMQHYGFSSVPPQGTEGVAVFVGGDRENGICIADNHTESKPTSQDEGSVCIYDKKGTKILLDNNGKVIIKSETIELGDAGVEALLKGETFQSFFNTHTHTGNTGSPTSPPISPSVPSHLTTVTKAT